ncbi:uracil permease [Paenibacillus apiarius]|uniref:Uracil permease n=1 Tax=Paenibacillus apiarius TaxID=46240 RepID=A0ABT4DXD1_9BACL|nr:uracil permease [Paenibacillus apiarius]MBN3525709.1 uracil permease [Paenibacillus apiarius]MCY9512930.1 uracil permease [Paenibacillus apiarius]MCY9522021.1 uracil permease [Paenibacillus apiarius]MCY9555066.1 uracil permease [Paenibacillus apiarius]MCY9558086.1 uracil permease [Paenibacillus apiarius]
MQREIQVHEKPGLAPGLLLSIQHLFAMFGSTVLVPNLFHIDPGIVLLMNGLGTLFYLVLCRGLIPAYLGSSFAFISPVTVVLAGKTENYAQALGGFIVSGIIFILVALIVKWVGTRWLDILFPPAAMGAIVAVIGLELVPVAASMSGLIPATADAPLDSTAITLALITLGTTIIGNVMFRGFFKIIPVLIGIVTGYIVAYVMGAVDMAPVSDASFFSTPTFTFPEWNWTAIAIIVPAALVVVVEHIGHLMVTSNIVGNDLSKDPGLHRSLLGNGVSTVISGFLGSTPNTTYGENIGVMALTRVYSVWVIGGAAVFAVLMSFFGKVSALIANIPVPVMGGVSLLLFGVIAASGLRVLVDSKVDFSKPKNLLLTTLVIVIGISGAKLQLGAVELKGMALATVLAIFLNLFFIIIDKLRLSNE